MATGPSSNLRTARASAVAGWSIIQTLELNHPNWGAPYYLSSWSENFTTTIETGATVTFTPFPFAVVLPKLDGAGQQDMQVTIANADADQTIAAALRQAIADPTQRITCTYREFLSNDLGAPQSPPIVLSFDSIALTDAGATGTANRSDVLNRRFPGQHYDVYLFPGLDR